MSDRTTLSVTEPTKERLDDTAPAGGSWDDRLSGLLDAYEAAAQSALDDAHDDADLSDLLERVERVEDRLDHLPERLADDLERRFS